MNNLRILLYVVVLSLAACHPEGTNVKTGIRQSRTANGAGPGYSIYYSRKYPDQPQMNEAQLAEYNLLCTQLNEDKNIAHTSDKQIRQAVSYFDQHGNELQKSKAYFYLACVESDLDQKKGSGDPLQGSNKACCSYREVRLCSQGVQTLQPLLSEIWSFRRSIGNGKKSLCQPANAERSDRRYEDYSSFCIGSLWCDVLVTRAALEEE